jgi:hypothetical protein
MVARGLSSKFVLFAGLLTAGLVVAVLLGGRPSEKYDASGPCLLASQYTKVTKGTSSVTYRVSYSFTADGRQYAGTDTVFKEPTSLESTVYYMSRDPQDNRLRQDRMSSTTVGLGGLALIVASWRTGACLFAIRMHQPQKSCPTRPASAIRAANTCG